MLQQYLDSCGRHTDKCNAWTWCVDESGCMDENGQLIPFKGCQLKDEPMQAWGLPSQRQVQRHKIANYFSGYMRSEFYSHHRCRSYLLHHVVMTHCCTWHVATAAHHASGHMMGSDIW